MEINCQLELIMTNYTQAEAAKEIRAEAKKCGLTFKKMNTRLNGAYLWMFVNRKTGEKILWNCTFWSAYENFLNGYILTLKQA